MKIKHAHRTLAVLGICVAALSGCKKSETPAAGAGAVPAKFAFNAACPIHPDKAVPMKAVTSEYAGVTIGFCNGDCVKTWEEWPATKKDEFIAAEKKALEVDALPEVPETPEH